MRLIDADSLENVVTRLNANGRGITRHEFKLIDSVIFEFPTIEERKTGRWKTAMLDHESFGVRPKVLYCSECHRCVAYSTKYCPNCGAWMEE